MATKPTTPKTAAKPGARTGAAKAAGPRVANPKLVHDAEPVAKAQMDGAMAGDAAEGDAKAKGAVGLRLKELVDRVVAATGGKKKGVKEIVEATLTQMGEALQRGESLNLPAFGKARVTRPATEAGGAMTVKLRQGTGSPGAGKPVKESLAEDGEDS